MKTPDINSRSALDASTLYALVIAILLWINSPFLPLNAALRQDVQDQADQIQIPHTGGNGISLQQRTMDAYEQMRIYRNRAELQKMNPREHSSTRDDVAIWINSTVKSSSTIFFYDDMESGTNGWTTTLYGGTTDDIWHQTTIGAGSPTHSWWPGIDMAQNYATGRRINTAVITPPINLTGAAGSVTLLFAEKYFTEWGWDFCMVDLTADIGSSWVPLRGTYGTAPTGDSEGWRVTTLDLTPYTGSTVQLRFYFNTGDSLFNNFPGWFVDDVVIFDQGGRITGNKFFDVNSNGTKESGEPGIKNWLITAIGPISLSTRTDYKGRFTLPLPLGSYTVSEETKPGWMQTAPPSGTWFVSVLTQDTVVGGVQFGNWTQASFVNGMKFHDLNRNGFMDGGDTGVADWKIVLADTNGDQIDYDKTDSTGAYSLPVFLPGTYIVGEVGKPYWLQSYPPNEQYTVIIPNLNTVLNGKDFGNYYSDSVNSIFGRKFNDLNRNGIEETHEPGVPGFTIKLSGTRNLLRVTDENGFYQFTGLPAGTYQVEEIYNKDGWWPSYPAVPHAVLLTTGTHVDSLDFGNYQISPSMISGSKWNDLNDNGIRDSGEAGISGWKINLSGKSTASIFTDGDGDYTFTGLWPGEYIVSETWRMGWRQTFPPSLGFHTVNVGPEVDLAGFNFGNVSDTLFSTSFRTFTAESLALAKDNRGKSKFLRLIPDKVEFSLLFINNEPGPVRQIYIRFNIAIRDSLSIDKPGTSVLGGKNKITEITLASPLAVGDSLRVWGFGKKPIMQSVRKWWWTRSDLVRGVEHFGATFLLNRLRLPMPNAINLLLEVGNGLRVGLGGPHSVLHPNYRRVQRSLIERGERMHSGTPRCLDRFEGPGIRPILKQQQYIKPARHNNVLFAEAIALKVNIRGSDNLNMPAGFGDLIYDEGTGGAMPLNGLSVREIAGLLDKYMSSYPDAIPNASCVMITEWTGLTADTLYSRIKKINRSFSGPVDTISFATGLRFTGVASLNDVTFLRLDTSSVMRPGIAPEEIGTYVPEEFSLSQNYPNPFNPTTTIEYYLPEDSYVSVTIYNTLGQVVEKLLDNELQDGGYQELEIDASGFSSGIYFYRLAASSPGDPEDDVPAGSFSGVKKMVVMK